MDSKLRNLKFHKNKQRGVSLIEIMVVIGMFTVVASFSMLMTVDSYRSTLSKNDVEIILSMLSKARSQSISNICLGISCEEGKPHGFHIESGLYTIFQGGTYDPTDPLNETTAATGGITNISGLSNVVFSQLSGDANPAGTIVVTTLSGRSYSIQINSEGGITTVNL